MLGLEPKRNLDRLVVADGLSLERAPVAILGAAQLALVLLPQSVELVLQYRDPGLRLDQFFAHAGEQIVDVLPGGLARSLEGADRGFDGRPKLPEHAMSVTRPLPGWNPPGYDGSSPEPAGVASLFPSRERSDSRCIRWRGCTAGRAA
jgi:hypothetical protein